MRNLELAAILSYLSTGAVLITGDQFSSATALIVWSDNRTLPIPQETAIDLADGDLIEVVRSTADGLEFVISDDGRGFLAEWGPKLKAVKGQ